MLERKIRFLIPILRHLRGSKMTSSLILPPTDKRSAILRARAPFARPRFSRPDQIESFDSNELEHVLIEKVEQSFRDML